MGIITLKRGDDIFTLNKKARNNVKSIKHGIDNNEIIIQEGVPTTLEFEGYPAEQMFYCVNGEIIEPIVRYNTIKNDKDSLNSKGMNFSNINSNKWSESELTAESIAVKLALLAVAKECSMISRDTL